jgi:hypothetical protein
MISILCVSCFLLPAVSTSFTWSGYALIAHWLFTKNFHFFKGDRYTPVHVNLKQLVHIIDKAGYYIHMNVKAENLETKAEEIFFAELLLPYKCCIKDYIVTACDIIGPECLGKINYHFSFAACCLPAIMYYIYYDIILHYMVMVLRSLFM